MPLFESSEELHVEPTKAEYHHVVLQQSVTMLAYMDRSTHNTTELVSVPEPRVLLGFSVHDLPILIGAAAGAIGLTVIILIAIIVWHCCRVNRNQEKTCCVDIAGNDNSVLKVPHSTVVHSQVYETQVLESTCNSNAVPNGLTRSQSLPFRENSKDSVKGKSRSRPASQPVHFPIVEKSTGCQIRGLENAAMPSITEGAIRSQTCMQDVPALSQCASYTTLEEPFNYSSIHTMDFLMKTRSLPTWSQGKLRPMSTEDDLNELYAKVNFSKKRKNRMGNDCAAAIAFTKSRCTALPFTHKDTDPLVDNEAVVVYDERTAV